MPAGVAARVGMGVGSRRGAIESGRRVVVALGLGRLGACSSGRTTSNSSSSSSRARARDRERHGGTVAGAAGIQMLGGGGGGGSCGLVARWR